MDKTRLRTSPLGATGLDLTDEDLRQIEAPE
jgi:hypothetical protein